jgi:8-oxo-dGTP pyrophosphatase MutT (NUDIX family)
MSDEVDRAWITQDVIRERLKNYFFQMSHPIPLNGYKRAAVLVLMVWKSNQWELVFTRRTDRVQTHKGQVSFPGGMEEADDTSVEATALREANEEIGIPVVLIEILGRLPILQTVTGFEISPVVGWASFPVPVELNPHEVEKLFFVPLHWLMDPGNWEERLYTRSNRTQEMVIYYKSYDGEVVWGATARMVWHLLKALHLDKKPEE